MEFGETETIKDIIEQFESCKYECMLGKLENSVAFIKLKEISERKYQTKRYIGEIVYTEDGIRAQVHTLIGNYSSQDLSQIDVTICKDIYQDNKNIEYKELFTEEEHRLREIKKAKDILIKYDAI